LQGVSRGCTCNQIVTSRDDLLGAASQQQFAYWHPPCLSQTYGEPGRSAKPVLLKAAVVFLRNLCRPASKTEVADNDMSTKQYLLLGWGSHQSRGKMQVLKL
jgi:hypothetical protein